MKENPFPEDWDQFQKLGRLHTAHLSELRANRLNGEGNNLPFHAMTVAEMDHALIHLQLEMNAALMKMDADLAAKVEEIVKKYLELHTIDLPVELSQRVLRIVNNRISLHQNVKIVSDQSS